jgi:hypothetical protein
MWINTGATFAKQSHGGFLSKSKTMGANYQNNVGVFTFPKTRSHFQNGFLNELSFSKWGSFLKCVFISKM